MAHTLDGIVFPLDVPSVDRRHILVFRRLVRCGAGGDSAFGHHRAGTHLRPLYWLGAATRHGSRVGRTSRHCAHRRLRAHLARHARHARARRATERDAMRAVRRLSIAALVVACLHLVFGAIVRISGSGMGCGDNWPKCYGYWFPPFSRMDLVVEVSHRYLASILVIAVASMVLVAFRHRAEPGVGGRA